MHDGPRTRYNRELGAQGVGNVLCGLADGLPMTDVIVRSSANVQAGAATRASTILHGSWILASLLVLPMVLKLVSTAALAGILVVTGWRLVSPAHARHLHQRYGLATAAIWLVTMVMVVATDLLTGVLTGLALSLVQVVPHLIKGPLRIEGGAAETVRGGTIQACRSCACRARPPSSSCRTSTRRRSAGRRVRRSASPPTACATSITPAWR